ncbi:LysR family transcriptional regulator [Sulfitobacter sp.]|jgi:DNA-binding transcriptional LysR family regulator|uniref:LysR family transcriptional regulator n=1 Tax=Sulfitobacter sp. TaxID=1903071 RepID=UPI003002B272
MKPQHVGLVVAIADAGSLGGAARQLNKTQSAITKALKNAEMDLGTRIFHRSPTGVMPTVEGQGVVDRCRRILRDLELLDEAVAQTRGDFVGSLNVIVSPFAAMKIMPGVLRQFCRQYPRVQLEISGGLPPSSFRSLKTGQADIVIGPEPVSDAKTGLQSKQMFHTGTTIITGATSRYLGVSDPKILSQASWITTGAHDRKQLADGYFESQGLTPPKPVLYSDSILTILSALEGSNLLCSFPTALLEEASKRWALGKIDLDIASTSVTIAITTTQGHRPTPASVAFMDLVISEAAHLMGSAHN